MSKTLKIGITAIVSLIAAILLLGEPNQKAPFNPAPLRLVSEQNIDAVDRPMLVLVYGKDCRKCNLWLSRLKKMARAGREPAAKSQEPFAFNLGVMENDDHISARSLPVILMHVPGVGSVFIKENAEPPTDIRAFVAKRLEVLRKEWPAIERFAKARSRVDQIEKPFQDELLALQRERMEAMKAHMKEQHAVVEDTEKDERLQELKKAAEAILDEVNEPLKDRFEAPIKDLKERREASFADLQIKYEQLSAQRDALIAEGVREDDGRIKAIETEIAELQAQFEQTRKHFAEENQALADEIKTARQKSPRYPELMLALSRFESAKAPYNWRLEDLGDSWSAALSSLKTRADEINLRRKEALRSSTPPVLSELAEARAEFEQISSQDAE